MTCPRKRHTRRERIAALALTLLLLAGLWLLAASLNVTGARQQQRIFRTLTLERVVLPASTAKTHRPRTAEPTSAIEAATQREQLEARLIDSALESALPKTSELEHRPTTVPHEIKPLLGDEPIEPGRPERLRFSDDLGLDTPNRANDLPERRARAGSRDDGRIAPATRLPDGPTLEDQGQSLTFADNDLVRPLKRRETPPELPEIEREESAPGLAEEVLDPDQLIKWMKLRPAELPPGIERHVDFREGNLTATAVIKHEGASYDLYLMARVPIREIHVVLVRGRQTYYLIDRSFQHEGRKFRTGTARRSRDLITGVVSEERAAASPEAAHFYSVFLAWWQRERLRL